MRRLFTVVSVSPGMAFFLLSNNWESGWGTPGWSLVWLAVVSVPVGRPALVRCRLASIACHFELQESESTGVATNDQIVSWKEHKTYGKALAWEEVIKSVNARVPSLGNCVIRPGERF